MSVCSSGISVHFNINARIYLEGPAFSESVSWQTLNHGDKGALQRLCEKVTEKHNLGDGYKKI